MPKKINIPTSQNPAKGSSMDQYNPKRGRPVLFQILDPGSYEPLYDVALALHVNPTSLDEKMTKSKTVVQTYGGFVEFIWPDELSTISASASTGAFIGPNTGLTAGNETQILGSIPVGRKSTIAWEKFQDLLELFHSNGMVFNGEGLPVIRGRVLMMYDRGMFTGHFTTFEVHEDDSHAYSFELSWEFRVEHVVYRFPSKNPALTSTPTAVNTRPLITGRR